MIKEFYRKIVPIGIRYAVAQKRDRKRNEYNLDNLKHLYETEKHDRTYQKEIEWMVKNERVDVFPYDWVKQYDDIAIEVYSDDASKMKYVIHNGRKLFFPRGYSAKFIEKYYWSLLVEQNRNSAHHYFSDEEKCIEKSVFVDVGAAEDIISLDVVDKADKIIMFECNEDWIEALEQTFKPWKDKISIVRKFVGSQDNETVISLDKYFDGKAENHNIVLKLDVEGAEKEVLCGAKSLMENAVCAAYICTYHNDADYETLTEIVQQYPFEIEASEGYMYYGEIGETSFRKGLIRAYRR